MLSLLLLLAAAPVALAQEKGVMVVAPEEPAAPAQDAQDKNVAVVVAAAGPFSAAEEGAAPLALGSGNFSAYRAAGTPTLGRTACDVNPSASVPVLTSGNVGQWGAWAMPTSCTNAQSNGLQAQVVVRNPDFYSFGLFIGNGPGQCPASGTAWSPDSVSWPTNNFYTGSSTSVALTPNQCTSNTACCVIIVCGTNLLNCQSMTVSVTYVAPPPTACGGTNLGLARIPSGGLSRAIGCQFSGTPPSGSTQDFALTNPNRNTLSVWLTDGTGPLGCGLPATNPTGTFSYNFYQVRLRWGGASIHSPAPFSLP